MCVCERCWKGQGTRWGSLQMVTGHWLSKEGGCMMGPSRPVRGESRLGGETLEDGTGDRGLAVAQVRGWQPGVWEGEAWWGG